MDSDFLKKQKTKKRIAHFWCLFLSYRLFSGTNKIINIEWNTMWLLNKFSHYKNWNLYK